MDWHTWLIYNRALVCLAKKEDDRRASWYQLIANDNDDYYYQCLLCGEKLPIVDSYSPKIESTHIQKHGIQHLKERNLLAFT